MNAVKQKQIVTIGGGLAPKNAVVGVVFDTRNGFGNYARSSFQTWRVPDEQNGVFGDGVKGGLYSTLRTL